MLSLPTASLSILAAEVPEQPAAPETVVSTTHVTINWTAPDARGSPILGYHIYILTSDKVTY